MAEKKKTETPADIAKRQAEEGTGLEQDKGYGGTVDYSTGKVPGSDTGQATEEQIKEDRAKQRNT